MRNKFKSLLINELRLHENSNPDIFYHFTTPSGFIEMVKKGKIIGNPHGTSFTEDPDLWTFRGSHENETDEIAIRMTFRKSSLPELTPYDDSNPFTDLSYEKEWVTAENVVIYGIPDKATDITGTSSSYYKDMLKQGLPDNVFARIHWID